MATASRISCVLDSAPRRDSAEAAVKWERRKKMVGCFIERFFMGLFVGMSDIEDGCFMDRTCVVLREDDEKSPRET